MTKIYGETLDYEVRVYQEQKGIDVCGYFAIGCFDTILRNMTPGSTRFCQTSIRMHVAGILTGSVDLRTTMFPMEETTTVTAAPNEDRRDITVTSSVRQSETIDMSPPVPLNKRPAQGSPVTLPSDSVYVNTHDVPTIQAEDEIEEMTFDTHSYPDRCDLTEAIVSKDVHTVPSDTVIHALDDGRGAQDQQGETTLPDDSVYVHTAPLDTSTLSLDLDVAPPEHQGEVTLPAGAIYGPSPTHNMSLDVSAYGVDAQEVTLPTSAVYTDSLASPSDNVSCEVPTPTFQFRCDISDAMRSHTVCTVPTHSDIHTREETVTGVSSGATEMEGCDPPATPQRDYPEDPHSDTDPTPPVSPTTALLAGLDHHDSRPDDADSETDLETDMSTRLPCQDTSQRAQGQQDRLRKRYIQAECEEASDDESGDESADASDDEEDVTSDIDQHNGMADVNLFRRLDQEPEFDGNGVPTFYRRPESDEDSQPDISEPEHNDEPDVQDLAPVTQEPFFEQPRPLVTPDVCPETDVPEGHWLHRDPRGLRTQRQPHGGEASTSRDDLPHYEVPNADTLNEHIDLYRGLGRYKSFNMTEWDPNVPVALWNVDTVDYWPKYQRYSTGHCEYRCHFCNAYLFFSETGILTEEEKRTYIEVPSSLYNTKKEKHLVVYGHHCCNKGAVKIPVNPVGSSIKRLHNNLYKHPDAVERMRALNSMFAFTSIYSDARLGANGQGKPILKRKGRLRHRLALGLATPADKFIKYVHRLKLTDGKSVERIAADKRKDKVLQSMMEDFELLMSKNNLVTSYQRCRNIMMSQGTKSEITMILPASRRERRNAEAHIPQEYADDMRDMNDELTPFLIVHNSYIKECEELDVEHNIHFVPHDEKDLHTVHTMNEFYEQLRYPLLFCQGLPGYYKGMVHIRTLKRPKKSKKPDPPEQTSHLEGVLEFKIPPKDSTAPKPVKPSRKVNHTPTDDVVVDMRDHRHWSDKQELVTPDLPPQPADTKKKQEKKKPRVMPQETVTITLRDYHRYILQERGDGSRLLSSGPLTQEFVIGCESREESVNLGYLRTIQDSLLYATYDTLSDAVANHEEDSVGMPITQSVLPSSYNLGPRYLKQQELNCKRIIRKFNMPTFFMTMTMDLEDPDLLKAASKFYGIDPKYRDDLVARVFNDKIKHLDYLLNTVQIFGETVAFTYRVEFQDRNMPHIHALLWLKDPIAAGEADSCVRAEVPDRNVDPLLHDLVMKYMIHGDPEDGCSRYNCGKDAAALKNTTPQRHFEGGGRCTKGYPKAYCDKTSFNEDDGRYTYRRRAVDHNQGTTDTKVKKAHQEDSAELEPEDTYRGHDMNSRVVPYNPALLAIFQCHFNVELCTSIRVSQYLHKNPTQGYIFKQPRLTRAIRKVNQSDEITSFDVSRVLGPVEAAWLIYGFSMGKMTPRVEPLPIHTEGQEGMMIRLSKRATENQKRRLKRTVAKGAKVTKLRGYMDLMVRENTIRERALRADPLADTLDMQRRCELMYEDVPSEYAWKRGAQKEWCRRKRKLTNTPLGRLHSTTPYNGERHYMYLIARDEGGFGSYRDWRTVKGIEYDTYQEAASQRDLLDDKYWRKVLRQAATLAPEGEKDAVIDLLLYIVTRQSVCTPGHLIDTIVKDQVQVEDSIYNIMLSDNIKSLREIYPEWGRYLKMLVLLELREKLVRAGEWSNHMRKAMALDPFMLSNII
eukprot:g95.t1